MCIGIPGARWENQLSPYEQMAQMQQQAQCIPNGTFGGAGGSGGCGYDMYLNQPITPASVAAIAKAEYERNLKKAEEQVKQRKLGEIPKPKETKVADPNEAIPDVSLTRVLKWAVVLMIAMALGERFWNQFGPRISSNLHRAIGGPTPPEAK